ENLGSQIARRRSFSISVSLKNERTDGRHRGKTIEKTMLRVLGSCTFSHSLGQTWSSGSCNMKDRSQSVSGSSSVGSRVSAERRQRPFIELLFVTHAIPRLRDLGNAAWSRA